jgi:hypothetical protein
MRFARQWGTSRQAAASKVPATIVERAGVTLVTSTWTCRRRSLVHARCGDGLAPLERGPIARRCIVLSLFGENLMTKSFPLSLVVAGACLTGASGCSPSSETTNTKTTTPAEKAETSTTESDDAKVETTEDAAETKTSDDQKRTPTGKVNLNAAAARPAGDVGRRAAAAPASASAPSHAVRPAQATAGARTASVSAGGTMAKPTADEAGAGNDVEIRGARVSRAVPAPSADGRVDNAARMLQLEAGEGESAG